MECTRKSPLWATRLAGAGKPVWLSVAALFVGCSTGEPVQIGAAPNRPAPADVGPNDVGPNDVGPLQGDAAPLSADASEVPGDGTHDVAVLDADSADLLVLPPPLDANPCGPDRCPPVGGLARLCVMLGEDDPLPRCVPDPRGLAFMSGRFAVSGFLESVPNAELVVQAIEALFNESGYKLQLVFPRGESESPNFDPLQFPMHVVQGARQIEESSYRGQEGLTTSHRATAVLDVPEALREDSEAHTIWYMFPTSTGGGLEFAVPHTRAGTPCFLRIRKVMNLVALAVPSDEDRFRLIVRINACFAALDVDDVPVGGGQTLGSLLATISDPFCDSNEDGHADGWPITLDVEMTPIEFVDDPALYENAPVSPTCN